MAKRAERLWIVAESADAPRDKQVTMFASNSREAAEKVFYEDYGSVSVKNIPSGERMTAKTRNRHVVEGHIYWVWGPFKKNIFAFYE